ncbi:MAG TPA: alpha/beta fold hydrolase, partial [Armatimonadota bacterium]|nr:alpha/beta fold hydrolase [Armatimonadota bacterium]
GSSRRGRQPLSMIGRLAGGRRGVIRWERAMVVEVNGTRLWYEQEGEGPDLLLVPGLGASTHVWYPQMRALAPLLRVTVVDPRGHGQSGKPAGSYSMRLFADDYAALLRQLGIRQAVVAGSSMSSLAAVEMAAAYPELVRGIVLVGGFAALAPAARERMAARAGLAESQGMAPLAEMVPQTAMGAWTHATNPGLVGLFRAIIAANDPAAYATAVRAVAEADVTALLPQVRCPALVLLGEQEQVAPLPYARALKAGLPDADLRVLPRCGHLPFLEQPAEFNAALQEWLLARAVA